MRLVAALLLFLLAPLVLVIPPARADSTDPGPVTIQTQYVAPGTPYVVPEVGEVRYYLFDEYKLILKVDNDLYLANQEILSLEKTNLYLNELVTTEKDRADTFKGERDVFKKRSERLDKNWKKCEDELTAFDWQSFLIGAGSGAATTLLIILGIVLGT